MWTLWQCTQNPTVLHLRDSSYRWIAMQNRPGTSRNGQSMPKDSLCNNKVKLDYIAQRRITPEITRIISSTSLRHILYIYTPLIRTVYINHMCMYMCIYISCIYTYTCSHPKWIQQAFTSMLVALHVFPSQWRRHASSLPLEHLGAARLFEDGDFFPRRHLEPRVGATSWSIIPLCPVSNWLITIIRSYLACTRWGPPVIRWFINPINYSYRYHKP